MAKFITAQTDRYFVTSTHLSLLGVHPRCAEQLSSAAAKAASKPRWHLREALAVL